MTYPRIIVKTRNGIRFLDEADIIVCKANGNYTTLFLKDGQHHIVSKKLKNIEAQLSTDLFFRIHHSHIVNLKHLRGMKKDEELKVILSDGSELEVSKRKRSDFMALFKKL